MKVTVLRSPLFSAFLFLACKSETLFFVWTQSGERVEKKSHYDMDISSRITPVVSHDYGWRFFAVFFSYSPSIIAFSAENKGQSLRITAHTQQKIIRSPRVNVINNSKYPTKHFHAPINHKLIVPLHSQKALFFHEYFCVEIILFSIKINAHCWFIYVDTHRFEIVSWNSMHCIVFIQN